MSPAGSRRSESAPRRDSAAVSPVVGLALAASPTFALMAWIAATDTPAMALCPPGQSILPVDSMTAMYLLMSLFHLPPWLKLARRPRGD